MKRSIYTVDSDELTGFANIAKDVLLRTLASEGLLKGDPEVIASEYLVIVKPKSWFGRAWSRWFDPVTGSKSALEFLVMKAAAKVGTKTTEPAAKETQTDGQAEEAGPTDESTGTETGPGGGEEGS